MTDDPTDTMTPQRRRRRAAAPPAPTSPSQCPPCVAERNPALQTQRKEPGRFSQRPWAHGGGLWAHSSTSAISTASSRPRPQRVPSRPNPIVSHPIPSHPIPRLSSRLRRRPRPGTAPGCGLSGRGGPATIVAAVRGAPRGSGPQIPAGEGGREGKGEGRKERRPWARSGNEAAAPAPQPARIATGGFPP